MNALDIIKNKKSIINIQEQKNNYTLKKIFFMGFILLTAFFAGTFPTFGQNVELPTGDDDRVRLTPTVPDYQEDQTAPPNELTSLKSSQLLSVNARMQLRALWLGSPNMRDRIDEQEKLLKKVPVSDGSGYLGYSARRIRVTFLGEIHNHWMYEIDIRLDDLIDGFETDTHSVFINDNGSTKTKNVKTVKKYKSALNDVYIRYTHASWLSIIFGSTVLPFSREGMTGSFRLVSIERSLPADDFTMRRDLGFQFVGRVMNDKLSYGLALAQGGGGFNTGINGPTRFNDGSVNTSPLISARVQFDPWGYYKTGRAQFQKTNLMSFGLGAKYQHRITSAFKPFEQDREKMLALTADTGLQFNNGNLELGAFYLESSDKSGGKWVLNGGYGQISWLFNEVWQPYIKYEFRQNKGMYEDAAQPLEHLTKVVYNKNNFGLVSGGRFQDLSMTQYATFGLNYCMEENDMKLSLAYVMGLNRGADTTKLEYTGMGIRDDWVSLQMQMRIRTGKLAESVSD